MNITKDAIMRDIKKRFGQLIAIPEGYFDQVIVRFGKGGRRQEKILHKGMFLGPKEVEDILLFGIDQMYKKKRKEIRMKFDEVLKLIMELKKQIEEVEDGNQTSK